MVDTRGYICPTPVLMVQKALKDRPAMVEVLAEAGAADGPDWKLTLTK